METYFNKIQIEYKTQLRNRVASNSETLSSTVPNSSIIHCRNCNFSCVCFRVTHN